MSLWSARSSLKKPWSHCKGWPKSTANSHIPKYVRNAQKNQRESNVKSTRVDVQAGDHLMCSLYTKQELIQPKKPI